MKFTKEFVEAAGRQYMKMPLKGDYRTHAHVNPLGRKDYGTPLNPSYVEFKPTILDVGCGYGNLLFELSQLCPDDKIAGFEIRSKVCQFVNEKIKALKHNSDNALCSNIKLFEDNAMKHICNYVGKASVDKIFICFADPHFKRCNERKRIVSQCLLTDYAYIMKPGARLYVVTDVLELHQHQVGCLEHHPMFTKTTDDLFVKLIRTQTDEAKKVIKEGGSVYHAVYQKQDAFNIQWY